MSLFTNGVEVCGPHFSDHTLEEIRISHTVGIRVSNRANVRP